MPPLTVPDPPLTDGGVVLRDFREEDVAALVRACSDALIVRYCPAVPQPYGEREARAWLQTHRHTRRAGTELQLCIADAATGELLGSTGLHRLEWHQQRVETGYWVAPWARGRGAAATALRLLSDWALGPGLAFARIELFTAVDNDASQAVARAAGFEREGRLRAYLRERDGTRTDAYVFSRTRSASGAAAAP